MLYAQGATRETVFLGSSKVLSRYLVVARLAYNRSRRPIQTILKNFFYVQKGTATKVVLPLQDSFFMIFMSESLRSSSSAYYNEIGNRVGSIICDNFQLHSS